MGRTIKILIVEDSEADAELLLHALREGGYEPIHERVDHPLAMNAALERASWDLIVADHFMPRFSSTAALALLKERGLDVPFLIVSGTISEDVAVETMKMGAQDYILKDNLRRLVPAVNRILRDAAEREKMKALVQHVTTELSDQRQRQAVVADIGQLALSGTHPSLLMNDIVCLMALTLKTELALFLELLPDSRTLLLRAGFGWKEGLVGRTTIEIPPGPLKAFPFLSEEEPIIFEDLSKEKRFTPPPLFLDHGVTSGMSLLLRGEDRSYGILGVYTRRVRNFTLHDLNFLEAVAHILAAAIDRRNMEAAILQKSGNE